MTNTLKHSDTILEEADIVGLISIIDTLNDETREEILKTLSSELSDAKKKKAIADIKQVVQVADTKTRDWLVTGIPVSYVDGVTEADELIKKAGIKIGGVKMTVETLKTVEDFAPHLQAVNALISDAYTDFGNSMNGVVRGAERMFNDALRQQTRTKLLEGRLAGTSIRKIAKEVKEVIGKQGFTVLLDRGGKKWSLQNYSKMLARTHLIKANNEATVNRMLDFGIDIVEVSSHGTEDDICLKYEGKIFSITGKSNKYPKLDMQPPFHPNCKHSLIPRPDLEG